MPPLVRTVHVGPEAIDRIARRACSLQGLPEFQYHLLNAATRETAQRGTYNVIAAMESLGWKFVPPPEMDQLWIPNGVDSDG